MLGYLLTQSTNRLQVYGHYPSDKDIFSLIPFFYFGTQKISGSAPCSGKDQTRISLLCQRELKNHTKS